MCRVRKLHPFRNTAPERPNAPRIYFCGIPSRSDYVRHALRALLDCRSFPIQPFLHIQSATRHYLLSLHLKRRTFRSAGNYSVYAFGGYILLLGKQTIRKICKSKQSSALSRRTHCNGNTSRCSHNRLRYSHSFMPYTVYIYRIFQAVKRSVVNFTTDPFIFFRKAFQIPLKT